MSKETIFIVEDEEEILELISYNLKREGYRIVSSKTGESALQTALQEVPDLILLDLMLPGVDGLTVCRQLKNHPITEGIPVIIVSAKGEESDIVIGLELGAHDYITKPFSPRILTARVKASLRSKEREKNRDESAIKAGPITIDPGRHETFVEGKKVELTYSEFRLLQFLASRPGWVFTRNQIVDAVRGDDYAVTERAVDVQVVGLRKKLGSAGNHIETVRGVGYRFKELP